VLDHVRGLRDGAGTLTRMLSSFSAHHVNREVEKNAVRDYVDTYFRTERPALIAGGLSSQDVRYLDDQLQGLLRLTQGRVAKKDYLALLKRARNSLNSLELNALPGAGQFARIPGTRLGDQDRRIVATLERVCPTAATSYLQALSDFQTDDRQSWRGTAVELREALRETVDTLAPDAEVEGEPGFRLEKDAKRPIMRQKVAFLLRSRRQSKAAISTVTKTIEAVEEQTGRVVRSVYDRSSASVHGSSARDEVVRVKRYVATVLAELLEIPE